VKTVAYPHPVAPGQAGFARQEYMALSRIFYDYSNILYGSRARAGLLILSKKVPPQAAKFML